RCRTRYWWSVTCGDLLLLEHKHQSSLDLFGQAAAVERLHTGASRERDAVIVGGRVEGAHAERDGSQIVGLDQAVVYLLQRIGLAGQVFIAVGSSAGRGARHKTDSVAAEGQRFWMQDLIPRHDLFEPLREGRDLRGLRLDD